MITYSFPYSAPLPLRFAADGHAHHTHSVASSAPLTDKLPRDGAPKPSPSPKLPMLLFRITKPIQNMFTWAKELLSGFWKDLKLLLRAKN